MRKYDKASQCNILKGAIGFIQTKMSSRESFFAGGWVVCYEEFILSIMDMNGMWPLQFSEAAIRRNY